MEDLPPVSRESLPLAQSAVPPGQPDEMAHGEQRYQSYDDMERVRARKRYEEYLDEQDSEKLPSAFDLGWKKNLLHLFGPKKLLWPLPVPSTTGDGWSWEASPKWLETRARIAREREEQRAREIHAGWGGDAVPEPPKKQPGAGRHYVAYPTRATSKADRVLGRMPGQYADVEQGRAVSLHASNPLDGDSDDDYDNDSNDDIPEQRVLDRKATGGWPQKVGIMTNTLLGNTLTRQKDDVKGWDGQDEEVD